MNSQDLLPLLNQITLPNSQRTLGQDKAIKTVMNINGEWHIEIILPYPHQAIADELKNTIEQTLIAKGIEQNIVVNLRSQIATHKVQVGVSTIAGVKNIIAVASGKGGVGKSTTTANLALAMQKMGARVGVLDADLYGPSQPTMLGVADQKPIQQDKRFLPVTTADGIQVMSIGFMVDAEQSVVWRGPMISQALQQLLFQSQWDDVDYLFIDMPPGTGDIQLTLSQKIPVTGAVIVTTPQDIALLDAKKGIDMFKKVKIPILGVIENMSMHICSQCGHAEAIFGQDGGVALANTLNVPLLGQLPLSLPIRAAMDKGEVAQLQTAETGIAQHYHDAAWQIALAVADKGKDYSQSFPKIVIE
jgi:ATP-binding protein involved in chromosome partitioning